MPDIEEIPQTVEEAGGPLHCFAADLRREEYIAFNMLLAKNGGVLRMRKVHTAIFVVMLGVSVWMLLLEFLEFGTLDPVMLLVIGFIAVTGGLLLFGMPAYLRHNAGRAYDQSLLAGHSYYGMVQVYGDRIEKVSGGTTSAIQFSENAAYLEDRDMMVILASSSRAIVLPARCMTREDADRVRQTILAGIPPVRQRLLSRLSPQAERRMPPPEEKPVCDEELYALNVRYEPEEFVKMVSDTAMRSYVRMLPLYSGTALASGLMAALLFDVPAGLGTFVLIMLALFLLNTLSARSRAKRSLAVMSADALSIRLTLTERGLVASGARAGEETRIPWVSLQHAVEKKDCVEFYNNRLFIRVPKRCIFDMDELRRVVDAHMTKKKS